DGFIRGRVLDVAPIPSSREGIMRRLKNATLVDTLVASGAPFEVEIELEADPASNSGFRWSSGKGPEMSIDAGTITMADVVVERRRVISLVLPAFDYLLRWLELRCARCQALWVRQSPRHPVAHGSRRPPFCRLKRLSAVRRRWPWYLPTTAAGCP